MLPIRTIVHPTDFSESAEHAFQLAVSLARDYGARLLVVHVAPEPIPGFGQGIIPPDPVQQEQHLLERLSLYVRSVTNLPIERVLLIGNPAQEILHFAGENDCDLIVMGTHGWTGLNRLLMGSVAEQVLRRSACPVLSVRMPFVEAETAAEDVNQGMNLVH